MKKSTKEMHKHVLGLALIVIAIGMLLFDFFSPPVGEISNFTLVVFAKLTAIAGALLNIKFPRREQEEE